MNRWRPILLSFFLLPLSAHAFPDGLDSSRECRTSVLLFAHQYYGEAGDFDGFLRSLIPGSWILALKSGMVRYDGTFTDGEHWHLPGQRGDTFSIIPGLASEPLAPLGSAKAREIAKERLQTILPDLSHLSLLFASVALVHIVEVQERKSPELEAKILRHRARLRALWNRIRAGKHKDVESLPVEDLARAAYAALNLQRVRVLATGDVIDDRRVRLGVRDNTHYSDDRYKPSFFAALLELVNDYYRQTGDDLILSGMLSETFLYRATGYVGIQRMGHPAPNSPAMDFSKLPIDVLVLACNQIWAERRSFDEGIGQNAIWLANFDREATENSETERLRNFSRSGDLSSISAILERGAQQTGFLNWASVVEKGGEPITLIPAPSTTGCYERNLQLAEWLKGHLQGVSEIVPRPMSLESFPMPLTGGLFSRIETIQHRSYRVTADVAGKVVVLVDDNITSGATGVLLTHHLYMKGAKAVFVFSLSRTGEAPFLTLAELLDTRGDIAPVDYVYTPREEIPGNGDLLSHPEWVNQVIASGNFLPWELKRPLERTITRAKAAWHRAFSGNALVFMHSLSESTLSTFDPKGSRVLSVEASVWGQLAVDDRLLLGMTQNLYRMRESSLFEAVSTSPLGQRVLSLARERLDVDTPSTPFHKQVGRDVYEWLREQGEGSTKFKAPSAED